MPTPEKPKRTRRPKRVLYVHPSLKGVQGLDQLAAKLDMRVWPEEMTDAFVIGPTAWVFNGQHAKQGLWQLLLKAARIPVGEAVDLSELETDGGSDPEPAPE